MPMTFDDDVVTPFSDLEFRNSPHPLWIHDEIVSSLDQHPTERKARLRLVLQHLASLGRTSVVKGCSDAVNRGWRRAPLGGGGGMQYYLWWSPQGGPQTGDLKLPQRSIVVRAVRHHDDHSPLQAGRESEYHEIETRDVLTPTEDALGPTPITDDQRKFVNDSAPVRVLLGRPGAGKTTALLNAVFARSSQRVLYVTWSERLCEAARQQAMAFAPRDTHVEAVDFTSLLGRILGRDLERHPPDNSVTAFNRLTGGLSAAQMGVWAARRSSLFAEVRAYVYGWAPMREPVDESLPRLSDRDYVRLRRQQIGDTEAEGLARIVSLCERKDSLDNVFPELKAARDAISRLRAGHLPEGYERFQKIAVDEAQDLTGVEITVLVELSKAIARANGDAAPGLLVAGDEGQTVRPSGFQVAELRRLLGVLRTPTEHKLTASLRFPTEIAQVIDRAQRLYGQVTRHVRPTNQVRVDGGGHVNGQVRHVSEDDPEAARAFLRDLIGKRLDSVLVVAAGDAVPSWLDEPLRNEVLLPHEAKGLEYQTVVVVDPGLVLADLGEGDRSQRLRDAERRTAIDRLRVAMTRATETLVFLDVAATAEQQHESRSLLGQAASLDCETAFPSVITDSDEEGSLDETVLRLVGQAQNLRDLRPDSAWRRAYHAMELLGDRDRPQGVAAVDVRAAAYREVCSSAIHALAQGHTTDSSKLDALRKAAQGLGNELGRPDLTEQLMTLTDALVSIAVDRQRHAIRVLEAACTLGDEAAWLRAALVPITETLSQALEAAPADRELAEHFASGQVTGWLSVIGYAGDASDKVRSLRRIALRTLLDANKVAAARRVCDVHDGTESADHLLAGRLLDLEERHTEAAEEFALGGDASAATAVLRKAAIWERAAPLLAHIPEEEALRLRWLLAATELAAKRPDGLITSLSSRERERLQNIFLGAGK